MTLGGKGSGAKALFSDKYHVEARRRRKESYCHCKAKPKEKPKPQPLPKPEIQPTESKQEESLLDLLLEEVG